MKELKKKLEQYQVLTDWQKSKIAVLENHIKDFKSIQAAECCECERGAVQDLVDLQVKTCCFDDNYFNGLTYDDIAELAKKSIRLTTENRELENKLERIQEIFEDTEDKTKEIKAVLKIIKSGK